MGKTSHLALRDRKAAVASGEVKLSDRKVALLYAQSAPESITGPVLSARRSGASKKVAAESAGLTVDELDYVMELARDGHPAWREFHDEWLRESAEPQRRVMAAVLADALDPERATVERQRFALEIMDPGEWADRGRRSSGRDAGPMQTQNFVVNIRERFGPPDVDAEDVEPIDG